MGQERWDLESLENLGQQYRTLLLDFSGTLARDGVLIPGVAERIRALAERLRVVVLTADTFGRAHIELHDLPVEVRVVSSGEEKASFLRRCAREVIAVGNGRNDVPMMRLADLSLAVVGPEGAAREVLSVADVVVRDVLEALDLLIHPLRLKATLRD